PLRSICSQKLTLAIAFGSLRGVVALGNFLGCVIHMLGAVCYLRPFQSIAFTVHTYVALPITQAACEIDGVGASDSTHLTAQTPTPHRAADPRHALYWRRAE